MEHNKMNGKVLMHSHHPLVSISQQFVNQQKKKNRR